MNYWPADTIRSLTLPFLTVLYSVIMVRKDDRGDFDPPSSDTGFTYVNGRWEKSEKHDDETPPDSTDTSETTTDETSDDTTTDDGADDEIATDESMNEAIDNVYPKASAVASLPAPSKKSD